MHVTNAWQWYEKALRHFEQGEYQEAAAALATIESPPADIPVRFLSEQVQRGLGFAQGRRRSDRPASRNGVIALGAN
jgi:hypothetical protein